jgi:GT2 family glycosyltransferase
MPRLAVVIVSWNVRELLASCLRSLFDDLERSGLKAAVWVVDNASSDGTPELVADAFPRVHLIASDENLGFAAGNNLALKAMVRDSHSAIRNSVVWLLNPDTEVKPGAAAALLNAMNTHASLGVAGAKLLYPDGSLQHGAFRFPGLSQLAFELFPLPPSLYDTRLNGRYPRRLYDADEPFPIDHPLGASMMARGEAIDEVGLMDEGYRMYCEEIDWCWRMHKSGWRSLCVPAAEVIHHAGQSTAQVPVSSFINLWTSRARLYARHHGALTWHLAQAMVRLGMHRRMAGAAPEMVEACRQVIRAWGNAR